MSLLEHIIAALAPHNCLGCRAEGTLICYDCRKGLVPNVPCCYKCGSTQQGFQVCVACRRNTPLHTLASVTEYAGIAKELVYGLKFARQKSGAVVVADLLAGQLRAVSPATVLITNVPTASSRVRQRGYDQAAQIAQALARSIGAPYAPLLVRDGQARQVGQERQVRLRQLHSAFRVREPADVARRSILLIDDVITTVASLETAARALRAAGARQVHAAVFAIAR